MDIPNQVEVLSERTAFQGFFRLIVRELRHRRFDGGWSPVLNREVFERGHAVAVLPYDPVADKVVMIRHFLPGAHAAGQDAWPLGIVAGMIEPGEPPEDVARRETLEEAGLRIGDLIPIARYLASPGASTETLQVYCALIDAPGEGGVHGLAEENEDIRVEVMAADDAIAALDDPGFLPSTTVIALQWLSLNRERLRRDAGR